MQYFFMFLILCYCCSGIAHAWPATVLNIHDGDTIAVAPFGDENTPISVRLYGIDAPELAQEGGAESTNALHQLLPDKIHVEVIQLSSDRYKRVVGLVYIKSRCINSAMLEQGQAWYYARYCKAAFCKHWQRLQKDAVQKKRGLWHNSSPIAPWIWRRSVGHE